MQDVEAHRRNRQADASRLREKRLLSDGIRQRQRRRLLLAAAAEAHLYPVETYLLRERDRSRLPRELQVPVGDANFEGRRPAERVHPARQRARRQRRRRQTKPGAA